MESEIDPQVRDAWERASRLLESLGHEVRRHRGAGAGQRRSGVRDGVVGVGATSRRSLRRREDELRPLTRHLRSARRERQRRRVRPRGGHARRCCRAGRSRPPAISTPCSRRPWRCCHVRSAGSTGTADPAADFERQKRFTPFTAVVNATGPAGDLAAALREPRGIADRDHAHRPAGGRGRPADAGRPTRGRRAVARSASSDLDRMRPARCGARGRIRYGVRVAETVSGRGAASRWAD